MDNYYDMWSIELDLNNAMDLGYYDLALDLIKEYKEYEESIQQEWCH